MRSPRPTPLRTLTAAVHKTAGWCLYRLGAHERARQEFERVLELRGDDFGSYVHLALVAYKLGDYSGWQRECGHARRTSPPRYARLKHPFELFEPRADGTAPLRTMPPSLLPYRPSRRGVAGPNGADPSRAGLPPGEGVPPQDGPPDHAAADASDADAGGAPSRQRGVLRASGDDFVSDAERARFRPLSPIDAELIDGSDLDELARRLGS